MIIIFIYAIGMFELDVIDMSVLFVGLEDQIRWTT